ncbi:hypothetical protein NC652_018311 [Populus alba x Populus x berolinensis]|nr:hypothetical protein NC652_018311 [Populus alba x Populus x berolinensis]
MYYKKRPELIHFVEDSYRAYRALAERYNHLSTELQNANNTIAYVFPEKVQFAMEEDEDEAHHLNLKISSRKSREQISQRFRRFRKIDKSWLYKLRKSLPKSSYEGGLAKYWEIELQIKEMQEKVCNLQDEFGAGIVIEDEEARTLMASAALKSCQETLAQLQRETREICRRSSRRAQKNYQCPGEVEWKDWKACTNRVNGTTEEKHDIELLREKIKENLDVGSNASVTAAELVEKIDELVSKIINLEASVSLQTALIQRLRTETDELQAEIQTLEEDKATLINGKNDLREQLREMEEKLHGIQNLNQSGEDQNNNLHAHFTEAHSNIDHLSKLNLKKLHSIPDDSIEKPQNVKTKKHLKVRINPTKNFKGSEGALNPDDGLGEQQNQKPHDELQGFIFFTEREGNSCRSQESRRRGRDKRTRAKFKSTRKNTDLNNSMEELPGLEIEEKVFKKDSPSLMDDINVETQEQETTLVDEPDWKQLFMNGMENRERALLTEYTSILRNYKEVKKKLSEAEKKNGDSLFDATVQVRELKSANAKKDEQIQFLRQKLTLLQAGLGEDSELIKSMATESPTTEKEETEDIRVTLMDQPETISEIEKRFRMSIDEVLEENLDFWLRGKKRMEDGSSNAEYSLKSEAKPLYKYLREIHTELTESAEDDEFKFTSYQAAKFQGEVLNMKQENNKVADELQAGLDHLTTLQLEVERTLAKLNEEFKLSGSKNRQNIQLPHSVSRSRVPLRSFIFGTKPKKHRTSIFSCMHPALYRRHFRSGPNA